MNLMNLFLKTQLSNLQNSKLNLDYFLSEYCRIKNNLGIFYKQENPHLLMKKNISRLIYMMKKLKIYEVLQMVNKVLLYFFE